MTARPLMPDVSEYQLTENDTLIVDDKGNPVLMGHQATPKTLAEIAELPNAKV